MDKKIARNTTVKNNNFKNIFFGLITFFNNHWDTSKFFSVF